MAEGEERGNGEGADRGADGLGDGDVHEVPAADQRNGDAEALGVGEDGGGRPVGACVAGDNDGGSGDAKADAEGEVRHGGGEGGGGAAGDEVLELELFGGGVSGEGDRAATVRAREGERALDAVEERGVEGEDVHDVGDDTGVRLVFVACGGAFNGGAGAGEGAHALGRRYGAEAGVGDVAAANVVADGAERALGQVGEPDVALVVQLLEVSSDEGCALGADDSGEYVVRVTAAPVKLGLLAAQHAGAPPQHGEQLWRLELAERGLASVGAAVDGAEVVASGGGANVAGGGAAHVGHELADEAEGVVVADFDDGVEACGPILLRVDAKLPEPHAVVRHDEEDEVVGEPSGGEEVGESTVEVGGAVLALLVPFQRLEGDGCAGVPACVAVEAAPPGVAAVGRVGDEGGGAAVAPRGPRREAVRLGDDRGVGGGAHGAAEGIKVGGWRAVRFAVWRLACGGLAVGRGAVGDAALFVRLVLLVDGPLWRGPRGQKGDGEDALVEAASELAGQPLQRPYAVESGVGELSDVGCDGAHVRGERVHVGREAQLAGQRRLEAHAVEDVGEEL